MRFRSLTGVVAALIFAFPSYGAYAQNPIRRALNVPLPGISITQPLTGTPIYFDPLNNKVTNFYDNSTESIEVVGVFNNVDDSLLKRNLIGVVLNGDLANPVPITLIGARRTVRGRSLRTGYFSIDMPLANDLRWPVRSITAELVNLKTERTLARTVATFWDLRSQSEATPFFDMASYYTGMRAQLTDIGIGYLQPNDAIDNLELQVKPLLPYPGLADFNSKLGNAARNLPRYDDDAKVLDACIGYENLTEPRFSQSVEFAPYAAAFGEAEAAYFAYRGAREICQAIPELLLKAACFLAAEASSCVKSQPQSSDFELCVDQIEADVQDLTIDGVDEIRLKFLNATRADRGRLSAHASVDSLKGSANAYLRSLKVRWKDALCVPRPQALVDDDLITDIGKEWLNEWATCRDLRVNNKRAETITDEAPSVYLIEQDNLQPERLKVRLGDEGQFSFFGGSLNASKGSCAESFINAHAEDAVRTFRPGLQSTFQSTWFGGQPDTMEAKLLTKTLLPFKIGEIPVTEIEHYGQWNLISSSAVAGLELNWRNTVDNFMPESAPNLKKLFFYAPPRGTLYSEIGEDHRGRAFDLSYTVTTGLLNHILANRSASPNTINFVYRPTWGELNAVGVAIPNGRSADEEADLNRATLRQISPAFRTLPDGKELEIEIKPIWNPIVHMAPDLDPDEARREGRSEYDMPLNYGIPILEVTFKEPDRPRARNNRIGKTWLRLNGGFTDRDFSFSLSGPFLTPHMNTDQWGFMVRNNNLLGCPMMVREPGHASTCEGQLESKVRDLISNKLRPIFIDLLREIPAPYHFNVDGESANPFIFDVRSKGQIGQNITFFGNFDYLQ